MVVMLMERRRQVGGGTMTLYQLEAHRRLPKTSAALTGDLGDKRR